QGCEGSRSDVQRYAGIANTLARQFSEQRIGEMESRGRRRNRARGAGIHGLVVIEVFGVDLAADVMRQREQARSAEQLLDRSAVVACDDRTALACVPHDPERATIFDPQTRALFEAAMRPRESQPRARRIVDRTHEQQFDPAAAVLSDKEPSRQYPGVVQNDEVSLAQVLGELVEA